MSRRVASAPSALAVALQPIDATVALRYGEPGEPGPHHADVGNREALMSTHTDTLPPMAAPRMCMLVLGTHRSGTSVTTALVHAQGFALGGPLLHVGDENPLGHFENEQVLALHESFLHELGLEWFDDGDPLQLAGRQRRRRWTAAIEERFVTVAAGEDRFAVKDPRMVHLLPLWRVALRRLGTDARAIVTLRHPAATARSLHHRNDLPLAHGERIWLRDMEAIRRGIGRMRHGVVRYEHLVADPLRVLRAGFDDAGVPWQHDAEEAMRSLVDPALNRSSAGTDVDAPHAGPLHRAIEPLRSARRWPHIDRAWPPDSVR
ncbi:MAG TPA: hypothetical protein DCR14_15760 [Acidimicrobiaceae bacterium]|nr:hypothetical protein [Acidimicrobiaceae bacterium]